MPPFVRGKGSTGRLNNAVSSAKVSPRPTVPAVRAQLRESPHFWSRIVNRLLVVSCLAGLVASVCVAVDCYLLEQKRCCTAAGAAGYSVECVDHQSGARWTCWAQDVQNDLIWVCKHQDPPDGRRPCQDAGTNTCKYKKAACGPAYLRCEVAPDVTEVTCTVQKVGTDNCPM